jgi:hypothetical protein
MSNRWRLAILAVGLSATTWVVPTQADIILKITEVWAGSDGSDITPDWFELTNYGDMPWVASSGPVLTVNDNGGGTGTDVAVSDLADIVPGESAIILMEGTAATKQSFFDIWNPVKPMLALANIGSANGSGLGLGQGGDGVNVWLNDVLEDSFNYTSATSDISFDVVLDAGSYVGNPSGAVATLVVNDAGSPAVGSPGMVVPEPASIFMSLFGVSALLAARRRR